MSEGEARGALQGRWLAGPLCIALVGAGMLSWTWGTWPNVLVDFGRELYVAWRLSEGQVLYRDIAYFNGPLSPYLNALWFELFGTSLRTLVLCNGVLLLALTSLLYSLLARVSDRLGATAGCLVFATVFAFNQVDAVGNDNYLTPYSHEVTHGLLLSLSALYGLSRYRGRPALWAPVCGLALGLVWLTKAEIFLAAALALGAGLALTWWLEQRPARATFAAAGSFAAAALLPPLSALALLRLAMPGREAVAGVLGSWKWVLKGELTGQHFYRATLGVLDLEANLSALGWWSAGYAVCILALLGLQRASGGMAPEGSRLARWLPPACGLASFAALGLLNLNWAEALRPLPIAMLLLLAVYCAGLARRNALGNSEVLRIALLVFALALLAKVILRVRLDQYGFALAMPAALILCVALVSWLPAIAGRYAASGAIMRAGALGAISAALLSLLWVTALRIDERTAAVGEGGDRFLAGFRAPAFNAALDEIERRFREDDSLVVLPEGVMLNYLARRLNPTGHINFMPPELIIFGEDRILEALRADPPDYVALTHKDTREYGFDLFGRGYGRKIFAWVTRNYRSVALFGSPPLQRGTEFGIRLMQRRSQPQSKKRNQKMDHRAFTPSHQSIFLPSS